jgi:hypothetical protein
MDEEQVRDDAAPSGASPADAGPGVGPASASAAAAEDAPAPKPHPWAETGRPRGLDAVFPPGGEDEAPPERVADERRMTRLLVLMVVLLVGVPTLLTLIGFVAQLAALRGAG